jgi:hypothetical protein
LTLFVNFRRKVRTLECYFVGTDRRQVCHENNRHYDFWHNYVQQVLAQFSYPVERPKVQARYESKHDLPADAHFMVCRQQNITARLII